MKRDTYTISVDNTGNPNDLSGGRPWAGPGSTIYAIAVFIPDAATNFSWSLADGADVPFKDQAKNGATVTYDTNAFAVVNMVAERAWNLTARHTGTAAQTATIIVEWD